MTYAGETGLAVKEARQMPLWADDPIAEDPDYLSRQLITYIGNKRALLKHIGAAVERVKRRLGKDRLQIFDALSGSGVVSRFFKAHASLLISNDIEDYAAVTARCYLRNRSTVDLAAISRMAADLNAKVMTEPLPMGFIEELYSPRDETHITKEDRVFYTRSNAKRLDNYRRIIESVPNLRLYGFMQPTGRHGAMNWKDLVYRQIIAYCNEIGSRTFLLDGYFQANAHIFCKAYPNNRFFRQEVCEMLQKLRDKGLLAFLNNTGNYTLRGIDLLNAEKEEIKTIDIPKELPEKKEYLVETYVRHVASARIAREVFGFYCLVPNCSNTFLRDDGSPYIEVHHIIPLCKNGENALPNLSLVCAHHHKMAHFADRATKPSIESHCCPKWTHTEAQRPQHIAQMPLFRRQDRHCCSKRTPDKGIVRMRSLSVGPYSRRVILRRISRCSLCLCVKTLPAYLGQM